MKDSQQMDGIEGFGFSDNENTPEILSNFNPFNKS